MNIIRSEDRRSRKVDPSTRHSPYVPVGVFYSPFPIIDRYGIDLWKGCETMIQFR